MYSTPSRIDIPPSPSSLSGALSHTLYDVNANPTTYSTILSSNPHSTKVLVLFIRNFLCGNCQQFLITLTSLLPPASLPPSLSIVIIGCGAPSLIPSYIEITQCPYPIYTDPTNTLYNVLGMQRSLSLGPKAPEYIKHSLVVGAMKSIVQGIKRVNSGDMLAAGEMNVNGGEFLFVKSSTTENVNTRTHPGASSMSGSPNQDPTWTVPWCHRMQNTRDHTEIPALKLILGLTPPPPAPLSPTAAPVSDAPPRRSNTSSTSSTSTTQTTDTTDSLAEEKATIILLRRSTTSKLQRTLSLSKRFKGLSRSHTTARNTTGVEHRPRTRRWLSHGHNFSHGGDNVRVAVVTAS